MCVVLSHQVVVISKDILTRGNSMCKSGKGQHIQESPEKFNVPGLDNRKWRKMGLER